MKTFYLVVGVDTDGDPRWALTTSPGAAAQTARDLADQCFDRPKLIEVDAEQLAAHKDACTERNY